MRAASRRAFLVAAGSASVAGWASARDSSPLYDGEVVDTHLHLWDLKALRLPWVESSTGHAREVLAHDHLLADYAEAARGQKVTRAVYMEVDALEADQVKEAEYVTRLCAEGRSPMVAAVISGRPAAPDFASYLDRFRGNPWIKGLRQILHSPATPPRFCLDPEFVRGIRLLGERGLSFDLCLRADQLDFGAELIGRCPGSRFVIDHCGNPHAGRVGLDDWRKSLGRIAGIRGREVVCKVSGLYGNVKAEDWPVEKVTPIVRSVIDLFGWDRVMFAGDWPVVDLGASFGFWADAVRKIVRDDRPEDQKKLFRDNAIRFYGLKAS